MGIAITEEERQKRFWSNVDKKGDNDCWIWKGAKSNSGYGHLSMGKNKNIKATHYMWKLYNGFIPQGFHVLHYCDVKLCVNPKHLHIGTCKDNAKEAVERGRIKCGEDTYNAQLTNKQVIEIFKSNKKNIQLARDYKVRPQTISRIKTKSRYRHILRNVEKDDFNE